MRKIYFAGSIRGGRVDAELYHQLIELLKQYGTVLTEHVGSKTLSVLGEQGPTAEFIRQRNLNWIMECNMVVTEVTQPSLGVGYEIGKAEEWSKPILCIFRDQKGKRVSAMIAGSPHLTVVKYHDMASAKQVFDNYFHSLPQTA
jgi:nucleoside 2-deoxyribosyltransferase